MNKDMLRTTFLFTSRKPIFIYTVLTIELIVISLEIISTNAGFSLNSSDSPNLIRKINTINPFSLFQQLLSCSQVDQYNLCSISSITMVYIMAFIILFYIVFYFNTKYEKDDEVRKEEEKKTNKAFNRKKAIFDRVNRMTSIILTNTLLFIIHAAGTFFLFLFLNYPMYVLYSGVNSNATQGQGNIPISCLSVLVYLLFLVYYTSYIQNLNVVVKYIDKHNYHSDNLFSKEFNFFIIYLKILISIESNMILFNSTDYKITVINIIIAFSVCFFTVSIFFRVYVLTGVLFVINKGYNIFRIFFLFFISFFLLMTHLFANSLKEPILFAIATITVFVASIYFSLSIGDKNLKNILNSSSPIYQIAYVISNKKGEKLDNEILHMFIAHKLKCNSNSNLCFICKENEFTFDSFLKAFFNHIKSNKNFTPLEQRIYIMINLIYLYIQNSNKIFKIHFKIFKIFKKNNLMEKYHCLYMNIYVLRSYINQNNAEDIWIYKVLKTYEETSTLMTKIINIADSIYASYELEKEIFRKAEEMYIARDDVLKRIIKMSKSDGVCLYSNILFKKIYEQLFNTDLDSYFSSMNEMDMDYRLSEGFSGDKVLIIKYEVANDNLIILNSSKELNIFQHKRIEDMIPNVFKLNIRQNFLHLIKENETKEFDLQFLIKNPTAEKYVQNISLKGKLCPSIYFDEFIFIATYELSNDDIIIFEENSFMNSKILTNFSKNAGNILCLTETMLDFLNSYKITFDDIFVKKNYSSKKASKSQSISLEYKMNLAKYINLCLKINRVHKTNEEDRVINMEQLNKLIEGEINRKYVVSQIQLLEIEYRTFYVYSIKQNVNMKVTKTARNLSARSYDEDIDYKEALVNPATPSVLSYMSNGERDVTYFQNTKQAKLSKISTSNLNRLTLIASFFILFLIFFSFSFMIIGVLDKKKLRDSYSILNDYQRIKKTIYITSSSLLNKFLLSNQNGEVIPFQENSKFVDKLQPDFNFTNIENSEIKIKLDLLASRLLTFQNVYLNSAFANQVNAIMASTVKHYRVSSVDYKYSIITQDINFFDNVNTFMNLGRLITDTGENLIVHMINYSNKAIDLSNLQNKNLSNKQLFGLEIIINYINMYLQSKSISNQLQALQDGKINSNYNVNMVFFILFLCFHLILILICLLLIRSLKILIFTYTKLIDDMFCDKNIVYMKKKLNSIRLLNQLYSNEPNMLLKTLGYNKKEFLIKNRIENKNKKKTKDAEIISKENIFIGKNEMRINNSTHYIIFPPIKAILFSFSLFYTYSFIFYFVMVNAFNKFSHSSSLFSTNSEIENNSYNNYNLLKILFFTNNTDSSLNDILEYSQNNSTNQLYIKNSIDSVNQQFHQVLKMVLANPEYELINQSQVNLMNCTYLYTNLNDSIINSLYNANNSLSNYFTEICSQLAFMNTDNISLLLEEINYSMEQYLFEYENNFNNKTKIFSIFYEPTQYDLLYLLDYVFRPMQQYINYNIIFTIIGNEENFYLLILILFLSLNILIDICLFACIKLQIIQKVLYVSAYIESFIDVVKIA